jgi:hypothetical protein
MELYKLRYNLYNYLIHNTTDYEITVSNKNIWFYGLISYYTFFIFILLVNYNKINLTVIIFIITGMFFLYYCYLLNIAIANIIDNKDFQDYVSYYKLLNAIFIDSYRNNNINNLITDIQDISDDTYMSLNGIISAYYSTHIAITNANYSTTNNEILFTITDFMDISDFSLLKNVYGTNDYVYLQFITTGYSLIIPSGTILKCDILVVGGGGSGGRTIGGGGGGGAVVYIQNAKIVAGTHAIVVGIGGVGEIKGENSSFAGTIIAEGGGTGSSYRLPNGGSGGSGGGAGGDDTDVAEPIGGTVGTVSRLGGYIGAIYGNIGGNGLRRAPENNLYPYLGGGGGGGAGEAGKDGNQNYNGAGGKGGNGIQINITGSNLYWGAGGGGSQYVSRDSGVMSRGGNGGLGGGGGGGTKYSPAIYSGDGGTGGLNNGNNGNINVGGNGGANTGSGGGGGGWVNSVSGDGGSGIVIIRFKKSHYSIDPKKYAGEGATIVRIMKKINIIDNVQITVGSVIHKYLRIIIYNNNEHYFIRNLVNNIYYKYNKVYYKLDKTKIPNIGENVDNIGDFFLINIDNTTQIINKNPKFYNDLIKYLYYKNNIIAGNIITNKGLLASDASKDYLNNFYYFMENIRTTIRNNENISIYDINNYIDNVIQDRDILRYIDIYDTSYNFLKKYIFIKNNPEDPLYDYINTNYETNKNYKISMVDTSTTDIIRDVIIKILKTSATPATTATTATTAPAAATTATTATTAPAAPATPAEVDYYLIDIETINNRYYNEEERKKNHNSINDYIVNIYNKLIEYYNTKYDLHIENFDVLYKENKRIDLIVKEKIKIYNYLFNIIIAIIIIILTIIMHVFFINIYYNY